MSPQAVDSARCSACHRPIWWGRTLAGRLMPVDPTPAEAGTVILDADVRALELLAGIDLMDSGETSTAGPPAIRVLRKAEARPADVPRYVSHFATCPAADRLRRR